MKRSEIKRRPLADSVLAGLEPDAKEYRELDGGGLYFRVKPDGSKSWQLRYKTPAGKWSWLGLGGSPEAGGKAALSERLPGMGKTRCYLVSASALDVNGLGGRAVWLRWHEGRAAAGVGPAAGRFSLPVEADQLPSDNKTTFAVATERVGSGSCGKCQEFC